MTHPATCPACGAANHCAIANATPGPCWCFNVKVAAAALDALPESQRGQSCLCPRCAEGAKATAPLTGTDEARDAD